MRGSSSLPLSSLLRSRSPLVFIWAGGDIVCKFCDEDMIKVFWIDCFLKCTHLFLCDDDLNDMKYLRLSVFKNAQTSSSSRKSLGLDGPSMSSSESESESC